jgi:hypothetical protein
MTGNVIAFVEGQRKFVVAILALMMKLDGLIILMDKISVYSEVPSSPPIEDYYRNVL